LTPSDSSLATYHAVDRLLDSFGRFGVDLGLDRILALLDTLGHPHQQVPIVHVAGTNGKGSVCAYLSSVLTQAGYRVGRYTSPHLVNWTERICINDRPIPPEDLLAILTDIQRAIAPAAPSPTQFEVFTAAMWVYFAQQSVDIAVIEVGLGGRLDATNVCDRPLVSVITSISRDHWQRLGPTVADIAGEKAGILKAQVPTVIGPLPPEAEAVVKARIQAVSCPAVWVPPAEAIEPGRAHLPEIQQTTGELLPPLTYPVPLFGQHQLINSALAIATLRLLQRQGWAIDDTAIQTGMANTQWPGRIQWVSFQGRDLLIDGAHNIAAAHLLREYVDRSDRVTRPVHWVMGMLSTKDHGDIFKALLREGDRLSVVPVPDHESADPKELARLALQICPSLDRCQRYDDLVHALDEAMLNAPPQRVSGEQKPTNHTPMTVVLCGSLYLLGYFFKHHQHDRARVTKK
jgi:dihydrofolate synthase/folylpolyglutamate synthase